MIESKKNTKMKKLYTLACSHAVIAEAEAAISRGLYELMEELPSLYTEQQDFKLTVTEYLWSLPTHPKGLYVEVKLKADFDELISISDDCSVEEITATFNEVSYIENTPLVVKFRVEADMDEGYLMTLRGLGKTIIDNGTPYYPPKRETIYCPTSAW